MQGKVEPIFCAKIKPNVLSESEVETLQHSAFGILEEDKSITSNISHILGCLSTFNHLLICLTLLWIIAFIMAASCPSLVTNWTSGTTFLKLLESFSYHHEGSPRLHMDQRETVPDFFQHPRNYHLFRLFWDYSSSNFAQLIIL